MLFWLKLLATLNNKNVSIIVDSVAHTIAMSVSLSYSTKWWWGKTLANLVNLEQFAEVLPIQIYIIELQVD